MKNTEFYKCIRYFSDNDFKEFGLFLKSPFFKNAYGASDIYQIIAKNKHYVATNNYDKILLEIISSTNYTEKSLQKIFSYLFDSLMKYFQVKAFYNEGIFTEILLNDYLFMQGNINFANLRNYNLTKELEKSFNNNEQYFYNTFLHNINIYNSYVVDVNTPGEIIESKQTEFSLKAIMNLDMFLIIKMVLLYVNLAVKKINNGNLNLEEIPIKLDYYFTEEHYNHYFAKDKRYSDLFYLYKYLYLMYKDTSSVENYNNFKNYILNGGKSIEQNTKVKLFYSMINYCILRQRISDKDGFFANEELNNLLVFIENGYFKNTYSTYLSSHIYYNYVTNCTKINDTERLKYFIDTHSDKLIPEEIEDMTNFGMAHYYFATNDFHKSLKHINSVRNPKNFYKYDLRNLELKIHILRNNYDSVSSILHNYKPLVNKDRSLTFNDKLRFGIFIKHTSKLNELMKSSLKKKVLYNYRALEKNILNEDNFVMKNWLLEKVRFEIGKQTEETKIAN